MPRPREFDEDKALEEAMRVFWEKGFEATSLSDLTTRMGIQRPSIYAAYGDKKGLFEAALRKYTSSHAVSVRASLQKAASAKEAFRSLFEDMAAKAYEDSPNWGCFCLNAMVELAPHDEKFEVLTREHQMYLSVLFQETLERGIRTGELKRELNAKALAQTLLVAYIGLTVLLTARPERSFVRHSVRQFLTLID